MRYVVTNTRAVADRRVLYRSPQLGAAVVLGGMILYAAALHLTAVVHNAGQDLRHAAAFLYH